jgi:hypothetical protein
MKTGGNRHFDNAGGMGFGNSNNRDVISIAVASFTYLSYTTMKLSNITGDSFFHLLIGIKENMAFLGKKIIEIIAVKMQKGELMFSFFISYNLRESAGLYLVTESFLRLQA